MPLRCHLLIGPPASGKTTLAGVLAQLTGAVVLSTDVVRGELFGDAAVQGPWRDIEALLHQRLREAVAAGTPVILDATHARRPLAAGDHPGAEPARAGGMDRLVALHAPGHLSAVEPDPQAPGARAGDPRDGRCPG
ncbi:MAG: AAA family ATPase [Cyanobium sp.]